MSFAKPLFTVIGYLLIAATCLLAGLALVNRDALVKWDQVPPLLGYLVLLIPVYLNRVWLYHEKVCNDSSQSLRSFNRQAYRFPLLFLGFLPAVVLLALVFGWWSHISNAFPMHVWFAAVFPSYLYNAWCTCIWQDQKRFLSYTYQTLIPTLNLCIVSFMFGWCLVNGLEGLLGVQLLLLAYWWVSIPMLRRGKPKPFFVLSAITLTLIIILSALFLFPFAGGTTEPDSFRRYFSILAFGLVITLLIGVFQSWRVVAGVTAGEIDLPADSYGSSSTPSEFLTAGTSLATALLLPVGLLTMLHPATTGRYACVLLLMLVVTYLFWFLVRRVVDNSKWWSVFGMIFGIVLPLVVTFGITLDPSKLGKWFSSDLPFGHDVMPYLATTAPFIATAALFLQRTLKTDNEFKNSWNCTRFVLRFLDWKVCVWVTALASLCLWFLMVLILVAASVFENQLGSMQRTLWERSFALTFIYLVIVVVVAGIIIIRTMGGGATANSTESQPGGPIKQGGGGIKQILASSRLLTSLVPGLLTFRCLSEYAYTSLDRCFIHSSIMVFVTMAGFILNDIYDREKDRRAMRSRPIAKGTLSISRAWSSALLLFCVAIVLEACTGKLQSAVVLCGTMLGVSAYSPLARRWPVLKGAFTATLCCAPILYATSITGFTFAPIKYFLLWVFIVGRELLSDTSDLRGDKMFGVQTLSSRLGVCRSRVIGWGMMFVCPLAFVFLSSTFAARLYMILALGIVTGCFVMYWKNEEKALGVSIFALILGVLALSVGK